MKKINLSKNLKKFLFIVLPIFVVLLVADLLAKHFTNLTLEVGEKHAFLPGFIDFINVHNNGAAWNMFAGNQIFLIVSTVLFLGIFGFLYFKERKNGALFHVASALIFVGCAGNLIDRIAFNYVRDMIHFEFWPTFPVFNIADICVCVGAVLMVIFYIIFFVKVRKEKK